jgi:RNA polymerase sigma factor (sigma-70 family)
MLHSMSETVIVAALRKGNLRRAVELILDSYQDEVFGYCARLIEAGDAVKVYQQIMTTALEELTSFTGITSVRAWLYGVARRSILHDHRRKLRSYPSALKENYVPVASPEEIPALQLIDEDLETCIGNLAPAVREVLQLSLWQGLLLTEVAHVIARSEVQTRRMAAEGLSLLSLDLSRSNSTPS